MLTELKQLVGKTIAAVYREYGDELPDNEAGPFIVVFTDDTFVVIKSVSEYHGENHETIDTYWNEDYYRAIINSRKRRYTSQ